MIPLFFFVGKDLEITNNSFSFFLKKQKSLEAAFEQAKTVEEGQKVIDDLLTRITIDVEVFFFTFFVFFLVSGFPCLELLNSPIFIHQVPDFRRLSQDNDVLVLKTAPFYAEYLQLAEKMTTASLQQRRAELRDAKFNTESRKERQVLKRKITTKLSNFFGVSKREAEVAAIRTRVSLVFSPNKVSPFRCQHDDVAPDSAIKQ